MHDGSHGSDCFGCKLRSIQFGRSEAPTHKRNGNPWEGNPVVERIAELTGKPIDTDAIQRASREGRSIQQTIETE